MSGETMLKLPEALDAAESFRGVLEASAANVVDLAPGAVGLLLDLIEALEQDVVGEVDLRGVFVAVQSA